MVLRSAIAFHTRRWRALPNSSQALGLAPGLALWQQPSAAQHRFTARSSTPPFDAHQAQHQSAATQRPPSPRAGKLLTVFRSELAQSGELARRIPAAIDSADVQSALEIFKDLPDLMLPSEQVSVVAQQLMRTLMSYEHWLLPRALRDDLPGGPALWYVGVPAPGSQPGGAQLLPLLDGEAAYEKLLNGGVRGDSVRQADAANPVMIKTMVSGAQAITEYLPAEGPPSLLEGLILNVGQHDELVLGREQLGQLRTWAATLRMESLFSKELEEDAEACVPASVELAALLTRRARLFFVRTPDGMDLARDGSGQNIIVLTSLDAAALCANAYGKKCVRPVKPEELLSMSSQANGEFGYTLTLGPDRRPYEVGGKDKHIPMWHTRTVTAEWLAAALRRGGLEQPH